MSETVNYQGKAREVKPKEGESITGLCLRIYKDELGKEWGHDDTEDLVYEIRYDSGGRFFLTSNRLFEVIEGGRKEYDADICNVKKNDDGTIDFHLQFNNGATCFEEMFEEGLKA